MSLALFDALPDFGKSAQPAFDAPQQRPEPVLDVAPKPDIAGIVRAEVAKAEAALEQRLTLEHSAVLEAQSQEHAAEIEVMLRRFGENAGAMIAMRIEEMETRIGDLATATAARILGTVLSEELQKRSVESLARSIRAALSDTEAVRIKVQGPQSLFETLREALADRAASLDYTETPGFDLTVSVDGTLFETRLSEWSAALSEVLS